MAFGVVVVVLPFCGDDVFLLSVTGWTPTCGPGETPPSPWVPIVDANTVNAPTNTMPTLDRVILFLLRLAAVSVTVSVTVSVRSLHSTRQLQVATQQTKLG